MLLEIAYLSISNGLSSAFFVGNLNGSGCSVDSRRGGSGVLGGTAGLDSLVGNGSSAPGKAGKSSITGSPNSAGAGCSGSLAGLLSAGINGDSVEGAGFFSGALRRSGALARGLPIVRDGMLLGVGEAVSWSFNSVLPIPNAIVAVASAPFFGCEFRVELPHTVFLRLNMQQRFSHFADFQSRLVEHKIVAEAMPKIVGEDESIRNFVNGTSPTFVMRNRS